MHLEDLLGNDNAWQARSEKRLAPHWLLPGFLVAQPRWCGHGRAPPGSENCLFIWNFLGGYKKQTNKKAHKKLDTP